jgi:hypothetical protein
MYEAPWSTPGEYEYQYTQAEGIIPPSYYDYGFTSVNTSGYAMDEYLYGGAYSQGLRPAYSSADMFDSYAPQYSQQYSQSSPSYARSSMYAGAVAYAQNAPQTQSAQQVQVQGYYAADGHWHVPGHVHSYDTVAGAKVLQCGPADTRWRADEIGQSTQYYVDGSSNTTTATNTVRPSCKLYPKATGTNTVILEWVTQNATTAFIDGGIGHVSLGTGGRMVTPLVSTVYTMTVVNERGASAQCAANIVVKGTAPVSAQTLTVSQSGTQQFYDAAGNPLPTPSVVNPNPPQNGTPTTAQPIQYDEAGVPIAAVTAKAGEVGGNILESFTSTLGSGQSIWERIRMVSMIALGIFIVLAVVVLVMRKMFGGGGEGGH